MESQKPILTKGQTQSIDDKIKNGRRILKKKPTIYEQIQKEIKDEAKIEGATQKSKKLYQWEICDNLVRKNIKAVDKDISNVQDYLKSQAHEIYFNRKADLVNLIKEKEKLNKMQLIQNEIEKRQSEDAPDIFQENKEVLIDIMKKYDIKHPLRGGEFTDFKQDKQPFYDKIINDCTAPNSYINYKKDQRGTLQFSVKNDEFDKEELEKNQDRKLIMRYRLFGRNAVNEREFSKLIALKIVRKKGTYHHKKIKKKIMKIKRLPDGTKEQKYEEMSGRGDECYDVIMVPDYIDNSTGNPIQNNDGFVVQPLCPEIFGEKAAIKSKRDFQKRNGKQSVQVKKLKPLKQEVDKKALQTISVMTMSEGSHSDQGASKTIDIGNLLHNRTQTESMGGGQRNIILMPHLANKFRQVRNNTDLHRESFMLNTSSMISGPIREDERGDGSQLTFRLDELVDPMQQVRSQQDLDVIYSSGIIEPSIMVRTHQDLPIIDMGALKNQNHGKNYNSVNVGEFEIQDTRNGQNFVVTMKNDKGVGSSSRVNRAFITQDRSQISTIRSSIKQSKWKVKVNQRTVPGSPFRFLQPTAKILRTDRINKSFIGKTATLKDPNVRQLLQKYPVGDPEDENPPPVPIPQECNGTYHSHTSQNMQTELFQLPKEERSKFTKKHIDILIRNIDHVKRSSKNHYNNHITDLVMQDLRLTELQKITETLKEIDFAEPDQIPGLFLYHAKDELEKIKTAGEVAIEFKEGKLDPERLRVGK